MKAHRLSRWLTLGANIGVLAGLIILVFEIRQANRIAIASTEVAVHEAWGSSNEIVSSNPELAALLAKVRQTDVAYSDADREMLAYYFARQMNIWSGIDQAFVNKMVSRATFDAAIEDMKWTVQAYPGVRWFWQDWVASFPSSSDSELMRELIYLLEKN